VKSTENHLIRDQDQLQKIIDKKLSIKSHLYLKYKGKKAQNRSKENLKFTKLVS